MKYTIKETKQVDETVFTKVEYNFSGTKVTVDVAHFEPSSLADITLGIENRAKSEKRKLNKAAAALALLSTIVIDTEVTTADPI
jgi:hypothetical protein